MPRPSALLAFFILLIGSLGTCQPEPSPPPASPALLDDVGAPLPAGPVRRIVPLAPSITEILFAIGAGAQVAGVSVADDFPPAVEALPRFNSYPMDYEALVALQPDLLMGATQVNSPREADRYAALGLPVVYFDIATVEDVFRVMQTLGPVTGLAGRADSAAAALAQRFEALRAQHASIDRPKVVFLVGTDPLYAFGRGSYIHDVIDAAGGVSLTADIDTPAPILNEEFVLTAMPDVIVGTFGPDPAAELAARYPSWRQTPALQHGRVYTLEPSLFLRPGPRLVDGAYALADVLHPEPNP